MIFGLDRDGCSGSKNQSDFPDPIVDHRRRYREGTDTFGRIRTEKHEPPFVENEAWPETPINGFILVIWNRRALSLPGCGSIQGLRRLCFDLIGLPPTPQQVEYFESKWKTSLIKR